MKTVTLALGAIALGTQLLAGCAPKGFDRGRLSAYAPYDPIGKTYTLLPACTLQQGHQAMSLSERFRRAPTGSACWHEAGNLIRIALKHN